jgi:hypothetical protein
VQAKLRDRSLARRNGEQLQSTVLNLDFGDLSSIVNGVSEDDLRERPFNCHFSKEKILWSWAKVGFVHFTRSCLNNNKVRKELGQHNKVEDHSEGCDRALDDSQYGPRLSNCWLPASTWAEA